MMADVAVDGEVRQEFCGNHNNHDRRRNIVYREKKPTWRNYDGKAA